MSSAAGPRQRRQGGRAVCSPAGSYRQAFAVPFSYPVHFTRDLLNPANPLLASVFGPREGGQPHRVIAFVDAGVAAADGRVIGRLSDYLARGSCEIELVARPEVLPGGAALKSSWRGARRVIASLGRHHLCRHSFVIALGGGSLLDVVGFAASLVHRGLRLIRVPTTVLAQCDAGVGVKNGLDQHGTKNAVGTFAPPHAVVIDFDFLRTLDDGHWRGGIAEACKVAIIKDAAFFRFLERNAGRLSRRDDAAMERLVRRCAVLHLEHIRGGGDPFEMGAARPLDFGHWAAHKLEGLSGYGIGHGQAVAIGIALDCAYAADAGLITSRERDRIVRVLEQCGLPVWSDLLSERGRDGRLRVLGGLEDFREHLGGRVSITLPDGIGRKTEVHAMDESAVAGAIDWLSRRRGG